MIFKKKRPDFSQPNYEPDAHPVRIWSNDELKKFSHLFSGGIVNISGWEDKDKQGFYYKDYFPSANSYTITNYSQNDAPEHDPLFLDLTADLPFNWESKFDVVFNHTVLEHIFDMPKAFRNMCLMTRDIVVTVVPFVQQQHEIDEYKDFWRPTPTCLRYMHKINGLEVLYESFTNKPHEVNYLFFIGSKNSEKWRNKFPPYQELSQICTWVG